MKILMTPVESGKPWNGATIYQEPLGGSESCVAYLARALVRRGHEVTVVTHGPAAVFDGVTYVQKNSFGSLVTAKWDILLSSRWVEVLNWPEWQVEARIIWLHDMPYQAGSISANRAILLTEFQAEQWQFPKGHVSILGNGVDLSLFVGPEIERNENVLVWTSNPDRGLPLAAEIFQEIRKRWPELELHVYGRSSVYGWGPDAEAPYLPRPMHMENVILHEPLTKAGLAIALREAWAWFYPTYWPETYCIAALEAQAAGTPCITVPFGALTETVHGGVVQWDVLNAVSQLRNKSKWKKESDEGRAFAQTRDWDLVATEWEKMFEEVLSGSDPETPLQ